MGLSHLLQAKQRFQFLTIGFAKQRRVYFSTPLRQKDRCSREQKATDVESYVKKYMEMHPGIFPKVRHVQNEVGGSWYTLKDILLNLKEKLIGNSQVRSHSNNGDKSNSTADATDSTVITSHNNSSEKPRFDEPESTPADALCNWSDISASAVPCISTRTSSENITDGVASETNRTYNSMENTEIGNPRSLIQSSEAWIDSDSKDNNVSHATCSSTEDCSSANMFNTTASEITRVHDSTDQTQLPEAACRVPLSDIIPNSSSNDKNFLTGAASHLCGDIVKAEGVSDSLEQMKPNELWNKKSKAKQFSCLIHEVTRTLQATTEYKTVSTGCRNQVKSRPLSSIFKTNVGSELGERPSLSNLKTNFAMHKKSKSEQSSCLIDEVTGTLQDTSEDKMVSTGCRNQVESKTITSSFKTNVVSELGERPSLFDGDRKLVVFVDLLKKKLDEQPEIEPDNGHLQSEKTSSCLVVSSKADQTTRILQEVVPNVSASTGNGHNQPECQRKVSCISSNVATEGGGLPASGYDAQKITQLADVCKKTMKDQEAGQMMTKCNILQPNGIFKVSNETIGGNVTKYPNMKHLTECIKKLPRGQQVVSTSESITSSKTD